ncbi:uncharacterized protein LOC131692664 [Topomyia yanbarensis]|uniref:uncharacterized protein LOC131692664 n=1 Tax=Topomyia yanbarensis TaxID=2498891 RepID=UPI00273BF4AE|nr:uncharacterized protein LOC131692664 [Topomyia yanbarensis]
MSMIGALRVKVLRWPLVLVLYCVVSVCSSENEEENDSRALEAESARLNPVYYAQMWYRTWQFPVIMLIKGLVSAAVLFFSFATTAIQGMQGFKTESDVNHGPTVIDGTIESYGTPPHHKWFGNWGWG